MAKMTGTLFPRGFLIPDAKDSSILRLENHREISNLYDLFIAGSTNSHSWSFRSRVFPVAMDVFQDFRNFLECQIENPFLYGYNYEFLLDTLGFIKTGRRRISPNNWYALMSDKTEATSIRRQERAKAVRDIVVGLKLDTASVIAQWCSHPGGFEDMVISMSTMFCNIKPTEANANQVVNWFALRGLSE